MVAGASKSTGAAGREWRDHVWWSADGLRLHARDYQGDSAATGAMPIICLPGLTRNARDFEELAPWIAATAGRRVIAVDWRGRGESGYARDALTYAPLSYVQDVVALLDHAQINRCAMIGTSLGGLVAMLLAAALPERFAGAVLNDVGPVLAEEGLERIRTGIGQSSPQRTWMHAAQAVASSFASIYPDWQLEDWLRFAKRTHRLTPEGRIVADYDGNIAQVLKMSATGNSAPSMWPAFDRLAGSGPVLILRGALSDVLRADDAGVMRSRGGPATTLVEVPGVGHAPTLDEEAARGAIAQWLAALPA